MASATQDSDESPAQPPVDDVKFQARLIRLLLEFAFDKSKFQQRVETRLQSAGSNIWMPKNGYLKPMQLIQLLGDEGGGFYLPPDFPDLLRRLHDWGIASDHSVLEDRGPQLILNRRAIKIYEATGVLENCVWGMNFMIAKYAKATPAIIIEKRDSEHIGTGSIIRFGPSANHKSYLLTNRHVVDPNDGISIKRIEINNSELTGLGDGWHLSSTDDLAAIEIPHNANAPYFCIHHEVRPLERVMTLGYPKIPFADDAYLAFHSGEINTVFRTTGKEEMFLISNQVGPGSSGGPVMDSKGLLVGVAAKAFQGKMEPDADYLINWNAAVTFKRVRTFLEGVSGIKDWIADAEQWATE